MIRYGFPVLLITFFAIARASAAINYDRIPADATGYLMVDFNLLGASQLIKQAPKSPELAGMHTVLAGEVTDLLVYTTKLNAIPGMVIEGHTADQSIHSVVMNRIHQGKSDILVVYQKQEIHFSSGSGLLDGILPNQRARKAALLRKHNDSDKTPYTFSVGLGTGDDADAIPYQGDCYVAFVGNDFILASVDLASMAQAIDVIQGNKPALSKQDSNGIRIDIPPGAMVIAAGLTAAFIKNAADDPAKQPSQGGHLSGNGFGLDLFGSLKAKAQLARFDLGETQNQLYADGVFTMEDTESAGQLKNLVTGVKALVSLTQADAQPLINPLLITAADKNVVLHWSWSLDKLPDLYRLAQSQHDGAKPTTTAATHPAH